METGLIPYSEVEKMSVAMGKGNLFGKSAEQFLPLMLLAQAEGRHPATVAMEYDVIQGRPALRSQAALSRFQESGGVIEWIERTEKTVSANFTHPKSTPVKITWTIERAAQMGLVNKDNWKKQPMVMLQWRCVAEGVRICYPACLSGVYLVEEVQDFDPPKRQARKEIPVVKVGDETFVGDAVEIKDCVFPERAVIDQIKAECERLGVNWQNIKAWIKEQYAGKYENADEAMHVNFNAIMDYVRSLVSA